MGKAKPGCEKMKKKGGGRKGVIGEVMGRGKGAGPEGK